MSGELAVIPQDKSTLIQKWRRSYNEKKEHRLMFAYYRSLGSSRSLAKVAVEFGKSHGVVRQYSMIFRWAQRLKDEERKEFYEDPVVVATKQVVDASRLALANVISEIADTLGQMTGFSKDIKSGMIPINPDGSLNAEYQNKIQALTESLRVFGLVIEKPKDIKDLVAILKDIVKFNTDKPVDDKKRDSLPPDDPGKPDAQTDSLTIVGD